MENKEYKKLHAEWYEYVSGEIDQSKEIEFWAKSIEESGEPALELGRFEAHASKGPLAAALVDPTIAPLGDASGHVPDIVGRRVHGEGPDRLGDAAGAP